MKKQKGEAITMFALVLFAAFTWLSTVASNNYTQLQEAQAQLQLQAAK